MIEKLNGNKSKIFRVICDYHKLEFPKNFFDLAVFDSSLHHTNYPDIVLSNVYKVLKPNGKVLLIREPILPVLLKKKAMGDLKQLEELRSKGVIENKFYKKQLKKLLIDAGSRRIYFGNLNFSTGIRLIVSNLLSGITKANYFIIAKK